MAAQRPVSFGLIGGLCQTEVEDVGMAVLVDQHVGWFEVAVDHPHLVGVVHGIADQQGPFRASCVRRGGFLAM